VNARLYEDLHDEGRFGLSNDTNDGVFDKSKSLVMREIGNLTAAYIHDGFVICVWPVRQQNKVYAD
jgi:hypothetical protein